MKECSCDKCQSACTHKPGWYKPGEVEKSAALLGMTTAEFFANHCMVDYWAPDDDHPEPVFILSPAISGYEGGMAPFDPAGRCNMYVDGKCMVHGAKPSECASYIHTDTAVEVKASHHSCRDAWKDHQAQITEILGRKPEMPDLDMGTLFDMMFGGVRPPK